MRVSVLVIPPLLLKWNAANMTIFIYFLACIGVHRLWNFEDIFGPARKWLLKHHNAAESKRGWSWLKPVLCQACNAFWIAVLLSALFLVPASPLIEAAVRAFAAYAVVRGILWVYGTASLITARLRIATAPKSLPSVPVKYSTPSLTPSAIIKTPAAVEPSAKDATCTPCQANKQKVIAEQERTKKFKKRIVLLTSLSSFERSYSLVSVILDQARMLSANPDWLVQIWVTATANLNDAPVLPTNVEIKRLVPSIPWKLDVVDPAHRELLSANLLLHLMQLGNATIITHDLLFIAHYLTAAAAIHDIGATKNFSWFHVCHSAAEKNPPMPEDDKRYRYMLPVGHKILCLNEAEQDYIAAHYHTTSDNVLVVPNARDITSFGHFDSLAAQLTHGHGLAEADVVQIFPVSGTRLTAKGLETVVDVFARLVRNHQLKVRLVVANAHSNGASEKLALARLRQHAENVGLPAPALVITSEELPATAVYGLPASTVKDLFAVSNVFVFPSISELASLVLLEAAVSGCLMVTNRSLHTLPKEVVFSDDLSIPFGSLRNAAHVDLDKVAASIATRLAESPMNQTKRAVLRRYSYEAVGETLRSVVDRV